jgi:hypothetical protein
MQERSIIERIQIPDKNAEMLEIPPDRMAAVELQLMQLREEMRGEFSAMRGDIRRSDDEVRRSVRVLHDNLIARLSAVGDATRLRKKR